MKICIIFIGIYLPIITVIITYYVKQKHNCLVSMLASSLTATDHWLFPKNPFVLLPLQILQILWCMLSHIIVTVCSAVTFSYTILNKDDVLFYFCRLFKEL